MRTEENKNIFIYTTPNELVKISAELKRKLQQNISDSRVKIYGSSKHTLIFVADNERVKNGE
jgi:hypothetical protein